MLHNTRFIITIGFIISLLSLSGCSSIVNNLINNDPAEEVIEKSMEAHDTIESVEVSVNESDDSNEEIIDLTIDFINDLGTLTLDDGHIPIFVKEEDVFIQGLDGSVEKIPDPEGAKNMKNKFDHQQNPLQLLKAIDEKFYKQFDMSKEDGHVVFTFNGNDNAKEYFGKALTYYDSTSELDLDKDTIKAVDIDVHQFELTFTLDESTYLMQSMEQYMEYEEAGTDNKWTTVYHYSNYDSIDSIEHLTATDDLEDGVEHDIVDPDLTDEELEKVEGEATAYVDALIQATVFQDVKAFIDRAPESMTKEDKESEAELQHDFFKEIYMDNTRSNMTGFDVSDEQFENLADAFLSALATTKYDIVDAQAIAPDLIVVSISVEGIDDMKVYADTDVALEKMVDNGEITDEEKLVKKNLEILTENYKKVNALVEPMEVDVHVSVEDGKYIVMQQDEYLAGFVR